ncbi:MAG TPA: pantoate--beta-alanine ligase [Solirubrobacteraceae bacterium]|nr:pantoate--beta-alanine ligase [Solirubrobacteraceae bacterium]
MRELDLIAIVGAGRLGTALAAALTAAGHAVLGPLGRGADARDASAVLLCVPDGEIADAAAALTPGPLVGHCSGATGLDVLAPHEAFSLHPLMTVPTGADPARFAGAGCAIDGTTPRALAAAEALATALRMRPTRVADEDRTAYHAAASIASNFLVTIEGAAERLAATAGVDRELLAPLVRAAVEDWAARGAEQALTGPIARGDDATVARQRDAIAQRTPDLLPLFDALVAATRDLAGAPSRELRTEPPRERLAGRDAGAMKTLRTVAEMREYVAHSREAGRTIALVPTMGAFHAGHHALMRAAREAADEVVVWLFVNPTQFNEQSDLAAYPRDEAKDAAEAAALGVDVLFAPGLEEVYPRGFATTVHVDGLSDVLEGAVRGVSHFTGVCTIVAKMLNMVTPDLAFFGQKDAQQVAVLRRMVADLDIPVRLVVIPTVREPDGLALSSRNVHLSPDDRRRAVALSRGLKAAAATVAAGARDAEEIAARARTAMDDVEPEYLALVDPDSFRPINNVNGRVLVAVAARVGDTRLIDNTIITTAATPDGASTIQEDI